MIRTVIKEDRKLVVLAFTDLDGTINDQNIPEKKRLSTIQPAKEAIKELQDLDIPVSIVTARSFGETMIYQDALDTHGFTIAEDGSIIILPNNILTKLKKSLLKKRLVSHHGQSVLILSSTDISHINKFINHVKQELRKRKLSDEIVSTCTSSPQLLKDLIHYHAISDAVRAVDRLASAFIRNVSSEQYKIIVENASSWDLKISGTAHHAHILGKDADKGTSIAFVNNNIISLMPEYKDVDGIMPIVFGNDYNDLGLFKEVHAMGGIGILVKDPRGDYRISSEDIPSYVIKTQGAYGYGMKEATQSILKTILD